MGKVKSPFLYPSAENYGQLTTCVSGCHINPEIAAALEAIEVARNRFDYADSPELIDAAIYELTAAELRLRAVIRMTQAGRVSL
ncbi:MAG: hypothetical protein HPY71_01480 [Firmicutes bacterium]|nr:hypothetical protein [Bacillota bacterium]